MPFDSVDEAIALANDTEYGLVAHISTGDLKTGLRVAERAGKRHDRTQSRFGIGRSRARSAG